MNNAVFKSELSDVMDRWAPPITKCDGWIWTPVKMENHLQLMPGLSAKWKRSRAQWIEKLCLDLLTRVDQTIRQSGCIDCQTRPAESREWNTEIEKDWQHFTSLRPLILGRSCSCHLGAWYLTFWQAVRSFFHGWSPSSPETGTLKLWRSHVDGRSLILVFECDVVEVIPVIWQTDLRRQQPVSLCTLDGVRITSRTSLHNADFSHLPDLLAVIHAIFHPLIHLAASRQEDDTVTYLTRALNNPHVSNPSLLGSLHRFIIMLEDQLSGEEVFLLHPLVAERRHRCSPETRTLLKRTTLEVRHILSMMCLRADTLPIWLRVLIDRFFPPSIRQSLLCGQTVDRKRKKETGSRDGVTLCRQPKNSLLSIKKMELESG